MSPEGLLSFPLTPFDSDDNVDLTAFADHVERQLESHPAALFVACGTGEFTALSGQEFRDVVRTAVKVVAKRVPVYAGSGGGPKAAQEYLATAAEAGADGALLLPPYLVTSTADGVADHIEYVAGQSPIPVIVYQRANAVLSPAAAVRLLDVPTVIGIKDGIGDVVAMLRLVRAVRDSGHPRAAEFGFLNGLPTAELSAQAYRAIGVSSYSSASLTFVPEIATAFYRAVESDDQDTVNTLLREFYLPFAALRDKVPGYAVSLVKAGAQLGRVRPPLVQPAPEHLSALAGIIERGRAAL